jgi:ribokinase
MMAHAQRHLTSRMAGSAGVVVVLASLNADLVVAVDARPRGGETVLGGDLVVHPGGKGANQAAAAALAGARVRVVGRVGDDAYGPMLRDALSAAGADVSGVRVTDDVATGVALILVTPDGENSIVVASGANARVDADDVTAGFGGDVAVAVAQLEVPVEAVTALARQCLAAGARLVLNAAPPEARLSAEVLRVCDPLVVNAHEASALTGAPVADSVETARSAAGSAAAGRVPERGAHAGECGRGRARRVVVLARGGAAGRPGRRHDRRRRLPRGHAGCPAGGRRRPADSHR